MPITLISGPANAGKAQLVMDAVRRHLAHGCEPLLIVPTRADVEHYLRELAGEGTALGVRVERFAGLISEVVDRAGLSQPLLGAFARERLIGALAGRAGGREGALARVTEGASERRSEGAFIAPGLVRAIAELFAELRVRRVTPARLEQALTSWRAADGSGAERLELGALFSGYCATLERLGRLDAEQRAVRALDALRERPALWGQTPVLLYGFDDLTTLQLDAIETLGRVVGASVTVSLAYEPGRMAFAGRAASFHALAPSVDEHHQLPARAEHYAPSARAALGHLERSLFEAQSGQAARIDPGGALALLEGGGERAELELVAKEIHTLLNQGVPGEEIAVLVRPGGTDLDLLEEVFAGAEVSFALSRQRPFGHAAIGGALIGLLRCVAGDRGQLGDLLAWLRAPGLTGGSPADGAGISPADRLEVFARRAGALSAGQARELWEQRLWPLEALDRFAEAQARGPAALCERAARELYRLFCAPRRAHACVLADDELDEAGAMSAGRLALAELRELAREAPQLAPQTAGELAEALEQVEFFSGARPGSAPPGAVAVLDPLALRARRVNALFVCGLQEGVFPARGRPQPVLSEEERRRLAEVSGLRLGEPQDALAAERYLLYAAASRPQERLFLSWHVADDDGEVTSRSLFVDDVCDLFVSGVLERRLRRHLGAIDRIAAPLKERHGSAPAGRSLHDQRVLGELRSRVWSPSSLERWIGCPMGWFVERMLRPNALEPDAEPLARGGLAHAALKDTFEGLRRETGTARLTPASLPRARELLRAALVENEAEYPLSVAPERRVTVRRRLRADLERYLQHAAACAPSSGAQASPLEPRALELAFGFPVDDERGEGSELPAFDLGEGVLLRGRIDRVDMGAGGEAVVYDYKSSRAPAGARWLKDGDLQVALYMLAVEELLQVQVVGGFYQPLGGEDLRARGVLDGDGGVEIECVGSDRLEHADVRELLAQALAAAREAAAQARRGELHARPQTCAYRGGCRYPSICRCER